MPPATPVAVPTPAPVADPNADRLDVSGNKLSGDINNAPAASASPLIVTSGASRAQYSDNVNTLNTTKANLSGAAAGGKQNYNFVDTGGKVQTISASSPEEAMSGAAGIDPHSGVMTPTIQQDAGDGTGGGDSTDPTKAPADGTAAATGADDTTPNADGTVAMADGTRVDASLASSYTNANTQLDSGINSAKATLASAAATLTNDPVATNAVNMILSKFDEQIALMKEKNAVLFGSARVNAARSGALQYAPDMNDNFMSEEQDKATQRISDLVTRESQAALQAQQTYQKGDVAAFNAASSALTKAQNDKSTAITKLLDETDKIVKERQAQQRLDQATKKNALSSDVTTASKIAAGMAASLKDSGVTDPDQIKAYVAEVAQQNGITNTDILNSALVTAQATASKAALAAKNTESTIAKRNTTGSAKGTAKGGTDGGFSYSADDIGQYTTLLNQGGKGPDGTSYKPRGDDGFVDPNAYIAAYQDWISKDNNGTPQGFVKKFPVAGNVNPAAYSQLPAALQPNIKTASTGPKYVTTPAK